MEKWAISVICIWTFAEIIENYYCRLVFCTWIKRDIPGWTTEQLVFMTRNCTSNLEHRSCKVEWTSCAIVFWIHCIPCSLCFLLFPFYAYAKVLYTLEKWMHASGPFNKNETKQRTLWIERERKQKTQHNKFCLEQTNIWVSFGYCCIYMWAIKRVRQADRVRCVGYDSMENSSCAL